MERVNKVLRHPMYIKTLDKIASIEANRIFCKHDFEHFLAVARIAYALCLEENYYLDAEILYTAAVLHDIGRGKQYEDGTPHEEESARIAENILPECGFDQSEIEMISYAILMHRTQTGEKPGFAGYLYRADKLSRMCFNCPAEEQCDWKVKNTQLKY